MIRYPGRLDEAVAGWLEGGLAGRGGTVREATAALTSRYKSGGKSAGLNLAAYLTTRLPATFAVNARVLAEVALVLPDFAPKSLRDQGAGPGTASWAAVAQWPSLHAIEQVEQTAAFATLARHLNGASGLPALESAAVLHGNLRDAATSKADIVIASYVLAELPEADAAGLGRHLWQQAEHILVLIEPGTPMGFARLRAVRERLLRDGARVAGPCTHDLACPMTGTDWCHFKQRVQRSRAHMQAKAAVVPYEDEPYAWLALSRRAVQRQQARIVEPVVHRKAGADFHVCTAGAKQDIHVATRDKATYKRLRKAEWGDALSFEDTP
jgi:ribosomal protein RSM22 (predicted rRNA methylase)